MKKIFFASFVGFLFTVSPVFAQNTFSDVSNTHPYVESIEALARDGVVKGYEDGSFRPDSMINRAEFLILLYRFEGLPKPVAPQKRCFPDVKTDAWYAPFVCDAKQNSLIKGYKDGRFHPADPVTLVEVAKLISTFHKLSVPPSTSTQDWYVPFLQLFSDQHFLPIEMNWVGEKMTRGQVAEILYRVKNNIHDRPSVLLSELSVDPCQPLGDEVDTRFDMERVRATWFSWINEARATQGLPVYTHNAQLDRTANSWSKSMRDRGVISHKRFLGDVYYDYNKITNWFAERGIVAKNINRVTHTENIGNGYFTCREDDCTDELITAIRPTFDFYMSEVKKPKGSMARAHYDSIMNKYFTQIGFGLVLSGSKVYSTTHYVTEIISDPESVCRR